CPSGDDAGRARFETLADACVADAADPRDLLALVRAHLVITRLRREAAGTPAGAAVRETERRKDTFLATLAHELRNALAPIRASAEVLRLAADRDPAETGRAEAIIHRQVGHMARLVDELLEISRITRGMLELRRERLDLVTVIRNAVESCDPLVREAGHQLAVSLRDDRLLMDADPLRLAQVFANLIQNAVKYTNPGGHIALSLFRAGDWAVVSVRDDGIGIPPQELVYVFDPFTRARGAGRRAEDGLGLGLSLAARLVELHGGRIEARSPGVGGGSEFVVRLPLAADAAEPAPAVPARAAAASTPTSVRVLVVDDNRDAADSLAAMLRLRSLEVRAVYDGPAGIDALGAFRPAVVLLDLGMPGMDGYETARRMRALPEGRAVALVALTGWGQDHDRERAAQAGFDHHLVKPARLEDVERVIASLPP
ncbi:MAG TPA: ATP-binding protein, partial [Gemmatimonadales bacterium]|nr:ATP-binding protein [Gemmatimonadales bacterium]